MRVRALIVLAVAAVLSGAPSLASATAPPAPAEASRGPLPAPSAVQPDLSFGPVELAVAGGGLVAVAVVGWFVLFPGRRRYEPHASASDDQEPLAPRTSEEQVTAVLHRRTLRRAHVRLEEDQIIASMGVGSPSRDQPGAPRPGRSTRRRPPA